MPCRECGGSGVKRAVLSMYSSRIIANVVGERKEEKYEFEVVSSLCPGSVELPCIGCQDFSASRSTSSVHTVPTIDITKRKIK